jgi:hypothetical protein
MNHSAIRKLIVAVTAFFAILHAPLGWCPPPPGLFLPDYVTYELGSVAPSGRAQVSINLLLNPQYADVGPVVINESPYFFYYNQGNSFAVDPTTTTCISGTPVTTTTGCTLTIAFTPATSGTFFAQWFGLTACIGMSPSCPSSVARGATFNFIGVGLPPTVPALSLGALLCLAALLGTYATYILRQGNGGR